MKKLCLQDCVIDRLPFVCGLEYSVEWNPVAKKMIIYNPYGYTEITKDELNKYFL